MNCFARHFFEEQIFYNCAFFKFIHIYVIFYHSEYRLLNFVISQRQNDVNCINNYINELCFSYSIEFNLYLEFPSKAGNFWNNPRSVNVVSALTEFIKMDTRTHADTCMSMQICTHLHTLSCEVLNVVGCDRYRFLVYLMFNRL